MTATTPAATVPVVEWPPDEKVKLIGGLSRPQVIGVAAAFGVFAVGIAAGNPVATLPVMLPLLLWTLVSYRGVPIRTRVTARIGWLTRRDKVWAAPIRGAAGAPSCLAGIRLVLVADPVQAGGVCVVEAPGGAFTVSMTVLCPSVALQPPELQAAQFERWGEVLGGLCVEQGSGLSPERIAWTDIHRPTDPTALVRQHRDRGVHGAATVDYDRYLGGFGELAVEHQVLISVTITRGGRLRVARHHGLTGTTAEVMHTAVIETGRDVADQLARHGFTVSGLLSPAGLGRMIVEAGDPYGDRAAGLSARERFDLAERCGPNQISVERHQVAVDGSVHRVFAVTWPRTRVDPSWCWLPLGVDGPKLTTVVFEPVAPSVADARREALTTRATSNNQLAAGKRGRVRSTDLRKQGALAAAERAVAAGHHELDGYGLIVISARTVDDLNRRCQMLRQKLREAGRAGVRELTGLHDHGLVAALPLGVWVKPAVE